MLTTAKSLLMIKNVNEKVDISMCQVNNTFNTFNARKIHLIKGLSSFMKDRSLSYIKSEHLQLLPVSFKVPVFLFIKFLFKLIQ